MNPAEAKHGETYEVVDALTAAKNVPNDVIVAALINALRRIGELERLVNTLRRRTGS